MNILENAISLENEGEKYYRQQADMNQGNQLYKICIMLADDEKKHAEILRNKLNSLPYALENSALDDQYKQMFKDNKQFIVESKQQPSQLDFYRKATELEMKSIHLYTDLLLQSVDKNEKELFEYLISQEKKHYEVLDGLSEMLRNSEEWIENAEFGIRKDF